MSAGLKAGDVHLVCWRGEPLAAYGSLRRAICAVHDLPVWADADLVIVSLPLDRNLVATGEEVGVAPEAGERRDSAATGLGAVTLSSNGNKKE